MHPQHCLQRKGVGGVPALPSQSAHPPCGGGRRARLFFCLQKALDGHRASRRGPPVSYQDSSQIWSQNLLPFRKAKNGPECASKPPQGSQKSFTKRQNEFQSAPKSLQNGFCKPKLPPSLSLPDFSIFFNQTTAKKQGKNKKEKWGQPNQRLSLSALPTRHAYPLVRYSVPACS